MAPVVLTFTRIEADSLMHRLAHLGSADDLEELFEDDTLDIEELGRYSAGLATAFEAGQLTATLSCREHVEALVDAVEGALVQDIARSEAQWGRRSAQSSRAISRSLETAAQKIMATTGREVRLPG